MLLNIGDNNGPVLKPLVEYSISNQRIWEDFVESAREPGLLSVISTNHHDCGGFTVDVREYRIPWRIRNEVPKVYQPTDEYHYPDGWWD